VKFWVQIVGLTTPTPNNMFFWFQMFLTFGNFCWEKNKKNSANSRKNANNKILVKTLG
jgi:hypothetical protein